MINVITVKHGNNKVYNHEYVNKMHAMMKKYLTLPHKFYCITEDPAGFHSEINVVPIPQEYKINGWWWKIYMFKQNLFTESINFYIDLDMIIMDNIDHYITYKPDQFMGLRDVSYVNNPQINTLGSGMLRWNNNTYSDIWDDFVPKIRNVVSTYHSSGDQAYIYSKHKNNITYWPPEWYESFKWEYEIKGHKPTSSILVFHGRQKPHNTRHPVVVQYWNNI